MRNFLDIYQNLPLYLDPIALRIGSFSLSWYSIMYLAGFVVVYMLLVYRINRGEANSLVISNFQFPISNKNQNKKLENLILDFIIYAFVGLLVGARLGYVLFYNFQYFFHHPLTIVSPFEGDGGYVGIRGMSYFGGVTGIILVGIIFCKKRKINFWQLADFVIPAIPAGYFFGRLGNFLNGELFGRATAKPWGMYFGDGIFRHPSQLYEAVFEGLVIFVILWALRNRSKFPGQLLVYYLFLYGFFRFFIEFFREPDPQIGLIFGWLTLGQIFSLAVMAAAAWIHFRNKKKMLK